jgi:hypothetical protein
MKNPSLEETVRGLLSEQKQHPPEPEVEEQIGSQFGTRNNPKKVPFKRSLGALEKRNWGGNQRRRQGSYLEEATARALKKVDEKKKARGKTDTGQPADTIDLEPTLTSIMNNR